MIRPLLEATRPPGVLAVPFAIVGCGDPEPVTAERYEQPDRLFAVLETNVAASEGLEKIVAIDHSRLGARAGSVMPPAKVLIFSSPELESRLVGIDPLIAIDLPLRVLVFETVDGRDTRVTFNSFDYLRSRYGHDALAPLEASFDAAMDEALQGIGQAQVSHFENDRMQPDGIVTLDSPYDFAATVDRLAAAIDAQDDTVWFGRVDFQARSRKLGRETGPALLLLFGGPAPGAKAMASAPTLGLDAFCQKLLVWQDDSGAVKVSFNDLLAVAERQDVPKSIALRVINRRLRSTFAGALE